MVDYWHTNNSETYHKTPKGWESEQTVRKKQIENLKTPFCATHLCSDTLLRFDKKGMTMLSKITDSGIFL